MSFFWNTLGSKYDDVQSKQPVSRPSRPQKPVEQSFDRKNPFEPVCITNKRNVSHLTVDTVLNPVVVEPVITFEPVVVNELNKYNIKAECTPVHSGYNSPRVSVDRLPMFDEFDFGRNDVVNGGVYKDAMVNAGVYSHTHDREHVNGERMNEEMRSQLYELQHKYSELLSEMTHLQGRMDTVTNQFSDLCQDF